MGIVHFSAQHDGALPATSNSRSGRKRWRARIAWHCNSSWIATAQIPGRTSVCSRCHAQSTLPPRMARWVHRAHCLEPCRAGPCSDTCPEMGGAEGETTTTTGGVGDVFVALWSSWLPLRIYHDISWYIYHKSNLFQCFCATWDFSALSGQAAWLGSSYQFGTAVTKYPRQIQEIDQKLSHYTILSAQTGRFYTPCVCCLNNNQNHHLQRVVQMFRLKLPIDWR